MACKMKVPSDGTTVRLLSEIWVSERLKIARGAIGTVYKDKSDGRRVEIQLNQYPLIITLTIAEFETVNLAAV